MQLTQDWMERLGSALKVHPSEVLSDPPTFRTVYIRGSIYNSTRVLDTSIMINSKDELPFGEGWDDTPFSVQFGSSNGDVTVWYIIESEMFYPFIRNGDFVRFTYPKEKNFDDLIGRICLIDIEYENEIKVIGVLNYGSVAGLYDVNVIGREIISNVSIEEVAFLSMTIAKPEADCYEDGYPKP